MLQTIAMGQKPSSHSGSTTEDTIAGEPERSNVGDRAQRPVNSGNDTSAPAQCGAGPVVEVDCCNYCSLQVPQVAKRHVALVGCCNSVVR